MKIRDLSIHKYGWTLRIYYAVTCYYTGEILKSLTDIGCPDTVLHRVQGNMEKCEMDTGFTYSNKEHRQSVIVIGSTPRRGNFSTALSTNCGTS